MQLDQEDEYKTPMKQIKSVQIGKQEIQMSQNSTEFTATTKESTKRKSVKFASMVSVIADPETASDDEQHIDQIQKIDNLALKLNKAG